MEKELAAQKQAAKGLEKKEKEASSELSGLRSKLIAATNELQEKQAEQDELETRLDALEKETVLRSGVLSGLKSRLGVLTSVLVQLSRQPAELFILHEDTPDDQVHRAILLRSLLPRLKEQTSVIATEIENFEQLKTETAAQQRLLAASRQNLEWQKHNLDQMVKARQGYLQKTAQERQQMTMQLEALTNEARDLRQLMEKVSNPSWGKNIGRRSNEKFPVLKGGLKKPVSGKIIKDFGQLDDFGVKSEGVTIFSSYGSPIIAPQSGTVVFTGPFKGYGKIVILSHAGGFHSFISGFDRIDADVGQHVDAGEPLGVLPPKGQGKPELYFEWRKGSEPIDPTIG